MDKLTVSGRDFVPGRIFCIGRNYLAHARELGDDAPAEPIVFMKPASCLLAPGGKINYPSATGELHYETEIVVLMNGGGADISRGESASYIAGLGLGLDLTRRDVQRGLISNGLPWEKSKSFEESAPLGNLVAPDGLDLAGLEFTGAVNGEPRQRGNSAMMIFPIPELIAHISHFWTLRKGDLIYTGTPAGIGPLQRGDEISVSAPWCGGTSWQIC